MDYEKKYKEALELMKDCVPDENGLVHVRPCDIFTELEESEDERIRKEILDYIKTGTYHKKWIAWLERQGEQKPAEWSDEDEAIYYGVIETEQYMLDVVNGIKKFNVGNISIKEECTRELNWLKSIKDRVQPQSKQEWNEEDESWLNDIISDAEQGACLDKQQIDWLKSLRPQSQWKPSDVQIEALESATENCAYSEYQDCLRELIEQLKKL